MLAFLFGRKLAKAQPLRTDYEHLKENWGDYAIIKTFYNYHLSSLVSLKSIIFLLLLAHFIIVHEKYNIPFLFSLLSVQKLYFLINFIASLFFGVVPRYIHIFS
jgi:hypothetical protein